MLPNIVSGFLLTITDLSDSGQVVGSYTDNFGLGHGFIYDGVFAPFDVPGSISTGISGINASDQIIGSYVDLANHSHAFIAIPTHNKTRDCERTPHWETY